MPLSRNFAAVRLLCAQSKVGITSGKRRALSGPNLIVSVDPGKIGAAIGVGEGRSGCSTVAGSQRCYTVTLSFFVRLRADSRAQVGVVAKQFDIVLSGFTARIVDRDNRGVPCARRVARNAVCETARGMNSPL